MTFRAVQDLRGVVVTGDAAHACHTTAAYLACERGGHYTLTVKGNHPGLLAQVTAALPPAAPGSEHHVTEDHSHGRIVHRAIWVAPTEGFNFPGAAQVFRSAETPSTTSTADCPKRSCTESPA